jgi:hypothetical protein
MLVRIRIRAKVTKGRRGQAIEFNHEGFEILCELGGFAVI